MAPVIIVILSWETELTGTYCGVSDASISYPMSVHLDTLAAKHTISQRNSATQRRCSSL
jgi:hypothetical protein